MIVRPGGVGGGSGAQPRPQQPQQQQQQQRQGGPVATSAAAAAAAVAAASITTTASAQQQQIIRTVIPGQIQQRQQTVVISRPGGMQPTSPAVRAATGGIQQTVLVNQPGGGVVRVAAPTAARPQQFQQTVLVNQPGGGVVRVQTPLTAAAAAAAAAGKNVVISHPSAPGSQITVPLGTLQNLKPGQGIPTGQAGHLLVKTDNGQYQILRVGGAAATTANAVVTTSTSASSALPTHPIPPSAIRPTAAAIVSSAGGSVLPQRPLAPPIQQRTTAAATTTTSSAVTRAPAGSPATSTSSSSSSSGGGGGMTGQMTPETAKLKCKNFLATLLRLASEQPETVARNVRSLIQGLIDGYVDPDVFTTKLQRELNSSPQPCLVPFLKKSLPYLQHSLATGELTIEGVRAPPPRTTTTTSASRPNPTLTADQMQLRLPTRPPLGVTSNLQQHQTLVQQRPLINRAPIMTRPVVAAAAAASVPTTLATAPISTLPTRPPISVVPSLASVPTKPYIPHQKLPTSISSLMSSTSGTSSVAAIAAAAASTSSSTTPSIKEKKSSGSFSVAGDEDINDVAAMGGVNLAEESQRMQGSTELIGNQIRSCKDETFLQTGLLHQRISKICRDRGLEEPSADVMALVSHATQERLKTLLEKLSVIAEHRMDIVKLEGQYEVTQDVKGQLRFLGDLDKLERRRHDEAERELLIRAAKSRTKTEDPEKEKLKAKAKELQRLEEEQLRHEKANNTALLAIGGPRHKKFKLDDQLAAGGVGGGLSSKTAPLAMRPRTKRVHLRDLMFLMEQERELKRSPLLWKSYCS